MKKIFIFTVSFFLSNVCFSQQNGIVYYGFIESFIEGNAKGSDSNSYMVFNNNQSYYVSAKDSLENKPLLNRTTAYEKKYAGEREHSGKRSIQGDQVFYDLKKKIIWSCLYTSDEFIYVKEDVNKLLWNITNETKRIGKFNCKKAKVFFRGRNYIAWFTTEFSVPFGPWKLNGLPGLIMEAYDTNKNVFWYFKNIEYPTKNAEKVNFIKKSKKEKQIKFVSLTDFKNFQLLKQQEAIETNRITQKQFKNIIFVDPKLSEMFIEFE